MSDNRPIGVFDSGIGGLTVVHEIFRQLPHEKVIYFGDTARVPYGTKSPDSVRKFAIQDILFLMKQDVKIIVAACNTVSAVVLDDLNQEFHLPVLGVVDSAVKAALEVTRNKRVGVIGTRGTILSRSYEKKLTEKESDIKVVSNACPLFVPLVEEGWLEGDVTLQVAQRYLEPLIEEEVDTLILGCTHYPLLKTVIRQVMGEGVAIIDSAEETAKLCRDRLSMIRMETDASSEPVHDFYVSDIPHQFQEVGQRFLGSRLGQVTRIDLDAMALDEEWALPRTSDKKCLANN